MLELHLVLITDCVFGSSSGLSLRRKPKPSFWLQVQKKFRKKPLLLAKLEEAFGIKAKEEGWPVSAVFVRECKSGEPGIGDFLVWLVVYMVGELNLKRVSILILAFYILKIFPGTERALDRRE